MDDRFVESLQWTDAVLDLLGDLRYNTPADAEQTMKYLKEGDLILKLYDHVHSRKEMEKHENTDTRSG